jgi:hypothetical protein
MMKQMMRMMMKMKRTQFEEAMRKAEKEKQR